MFYTLMGMCYIGVYTQHNSMNFIVEVYAFYIKLIISQFFKRLHL